MVLKKPSLTFTDVNNTKKREVLNAYEKFSKLSKRVARRFNYLLW